MVKKLTVIVFENERTYGLLSNGVCESLAKPDDSREFCGLWREIQNNEKEVITSISATVNHFIDSHKQEVIFGCCGKDYSAIMAKIDLSKCTVNKVLAEGEYKLP